MRGSRWRKLRNLFFFCEPFHFVKRGLGRKHILSGIERCISKEDNTFLSSVYTKEEVVRVVKDMSPTKVSGMDGFPTIFFQQCWLIVGKEVSEFCLGVLNNGWSLKSMNITNIVILSKICNPTSMENFRPISLCNVIYKVIANMVANRFRNCNTQISNIVVG